MSEPAAAGEALPVDVTQSENADQTSREMLLVSFSAEGEKIDETKVMGNPMELEAEREAAENELQHDHPGGYVRLWDERTS